MVSLVATKWRMAELMARHRIKNKELADELEIRPNSVTDLKKADTMPRIDGTRLDQIAAAITKLSKIGGVVRGIDLLEDRED